MPDSHTDSAPPDVSSAGWNTNSTLRRSPRPEPCARPSTHSAATSAIAMWASCPQAYMRPGCVERNPTPERSSIGSASMSARIATVSAAPKSNHAVTHERQGRSTTHDRRPSTPST